MILAKPFYCLKIYVLFECIDPDNNDTNIRLMEKYSPNVVLFMQVVRVYTKRLGSWASTPFCVNLHGYYSSMYINQMMACMKGKNATIRNNGQKWMTENSNTTRVPETKQFFDKISL